MSEDEVRVGSTTSAAASYWLGIVVGVLSGALVAWLITFCVMR